MADLAAEILRLTSAPYAVSLKNLETILKDSDPYYLRSWADAHPCQVQPFARTVIDALEFCPYALAVVEYTGCVTCIRDEILAVNNGLLDTFLRNAVQDDNNYEKYAPACLSLLSTPLPAHVAPPALLSTFFLKCVDLATRNTSADSIKSIYILVRNGYSYLAELLSSNQRHSFHRQMAKFLTIQDNTIVILSLATLACMIPDDKNLSQTPEGRQKTGTIEFFHGKRATKVLGLVMSIVIDLASREAAEWRRCVELIDMATVIVGAVADALKAAWAEKEHINFQKLLEKASRPDLDRRVLTEILEFAMTVNASSPVTGLRDGIVKLSQKSYNEEVSHFKPMFLPPALAQFFAFPATGEIVTDILRSTMRLALSVGPLTVEHQRCLEERVQFINKLNSHVPKSESLRKGLLNSLVTNEFQNPVNAFIASNPGSAGQACTDHEACPTSIANSRRNLSMTLCTLLLRCSFYSRGGDSDGARLDPALASSLMEKHARLSDAQHTCSTAPSTLAVSKISLLEASATPETRFSSRNWRQNLADGLTRESARQYDFVVASVGELCRDLERRCETVETPLRESEARCAALQAEMEEWRAKYAEAERRSEMLEAVTEEKERLDNELAGANSTIADHAERITLLEEQLATSLEETRRVQEQGQASSAAAEEAYRTEIESMRTAADKAAMEHLMVLNERQGRIAELEEGAMHTEQEKDNLREELQRLQAGKDRAEEKQAWFDRELNETTLELECRKTELLRKMNRIEKLEADIRDADDEEGKLNDMLDKAQAVEERLRAMNEKLEERVEELRADARKAKEHGEKTCGDLRADHNTAINRLKLAHQDEVHKLRTEAQEARATLTAQHDAQVAENRALTKKMNKLRAHQEDKEKEAQALTRQLLGLMSTSAALSTTTAAADLDSPSPPPPAPARAPPALAATTNAQTNARRRASCDPAGISPAKPPPSKRARNLPPLSAAPAQPKLSFRPGKPTTTTSKAASRKSYPMGKHVTLLPPSVALVVAEKENAPPVPSDIVKDTPVQQGDEGEDVRDAGDVGETQNTQSTNYPGATGVVFTSTPMAGVAPESQDFTTVTGISVSRAFDGETTAMSEL